MKIFMLMASLWLCLLSQCFADVTFTSFIKNRSYAGIGSSSATINDASTTYNLVEDLHVNTASINRVSRHEGIVTLTGPAGQTRNIFFRNTGKAVLFAKLMKQHTPLNKMDQVLRIIEKDAVIGGWTAISRASELYILDEADRNKFYRLDTYLEDLAAGRNPRPARIAKDEKQFMKYIMGHDLDKYTTIDGVRVRIKKKRSTRDE